MRCEIAGMFGYSSLPLGLYDLCPNKSMCFLLFRTKSVPCSQAATMASFEDDFRFSRPPNGHVTTSVEGDDDEPIFGAEDSFAEEHDQQRARSWRKRWRPDFADEKNGSGLNGFPGSNGDATFDGEPFSAGPASDENIELYALLNLDKEASTQHVLKSYRSLAVAFQ